MEREVVGSINIIIREPLIPRRKKVRNAFEEGRKKATVRTRSLYENAVEVRRNTSLSSSSSSSFHFLPWTGLLEKRENLESFLQEKKKMKKMENEGTHLSQKR